LIVNLGDLCGFCDCMITVFQEMAAVKHQVDGEQYRKNNSKDTMGDCDRNHFGVSKMDG
jgi:hypothetical protein